MLDHDFLAAHCHGFDEYADAARATPLETVLEATGIDRAQLDRVAAMLAGSERTIVCWAMGLTQHTHAVATIGEVTNVLLLRGMIGKPGAGVCPVRGHSNVQGDRTMGIWEKAPDAFLDALERRFAIAVPRRHGYDTVNTIRAMRAGAASVFIGMGGNFAAADPGHRGDRGGAWQLRADRPGVDQTQPQPRVTGRHRDDPARPGPHRPRPRRGPQTGSSR